MSKKLLFILIIVILVSLLLFASAVICCQEEEKGTYSIYFMDEQVGYEEFVWRTVERGYELEVMGQITKPVSVQIERLLVQLDKDFIPLGYQFKGVLSGTRQSISSTISDGTVHNIIHVEGQKQERTFQIKRDSFLLSNPIFSLYMVITKKFQ
ncbi:MAG: hypothetical protein GF421_09940, partial [Candidatus Aminicenantes bacterium]|nr:hypothetical protein [Candidatus Aminicenantes bacterium]